MPPRRGGRGRGKMRARPPQVIRNSMTEIGMGSIATFESLAKAAAAQNADAARAYFPALDDEKKAKPMPLAESEVKFIKLSRDIRLSINKSPVAIRRQARKAHNGYDSHLLGLKRFFRTATADEAPDEQTEDIWDLEKCWIIPEVIPAELVPPHVRRKRDVGRPAKRARTANESDASGTPNAGQQSTIPATENDGGDNPTDVPDAGPRDDEDDADVNAAEPERAEDEDDYELDADYHTGVRFDDDDGYEDPDSGAEEATF